MMKFWLFVLTAISVMFVISIPSDAHALLQVAGIPEMELYPGQSQEYSWGLLSGNTDESITVYISAKGDGSEFLTYPESVVIDPKFAKYVTIKVTIPDDAKSGYYEPSLFATQLGETGGQVMINVAMQKYIKITVVEPEPELEPILQNNTPQYFVVNVGNEAFNVEYDVTGISVSGMEADLDYTSLMISVDVTNSSGTLEITFERTFFDATFEGVDDDFIILVDGDEANFTEIQRNSQSRTLIIELPAGAEEIEIIGSEFGNTEKNTSQELPVPELSPKAIQKYHEKISKWNDKIDKLGDRVEKLENKGKFEKADNVILKISYLELLVEVTENFVCTHSSTINCD